MRTFEIEQTHGMVRLHGVSEQQTSDGLDWRSAFVSKQGEEPFRGAFMAKDPLMVLHRKSVVGFVDLHRRVGAQAPAGSIRTVDPGRPFEVELSAPTETVHFYMRHHIWEEVVMDMTGKDPSRVRFDSRLIMSDPVLVSLFSTAVEGMLSRIREPFLTDHLSRTMAAHILTAHMGISPTWKATTGGGRHSPEVSRAIEYIHANADRSIGLQDVADAAFRSASHLARLFTAEVGMPPHRYLINVRLQRAQQLLARTNTPIAQIAFDCGFSHQEHLTRTFRKFMKTTPAAYRREAGHR